MLVIDRRGGCGVAVISTPLIRRGAVHPLEIRSGRAGSHCQTPHFGHKGLRVLSRHPPSRSHALILAPISRVTRLPWLSWVFAALHYYMWCMWYCTIQTILYCDCSNRISKDQPLPCFYESCFVVHSKKRQRFDQPSKLLIYAASHYESASQQACSSR